MKILLNTHALLWYVLDDVRLSVPARQVIDGLESRALVSPASYWEIAIKISLKKYVLAVPFGVFWKCAIEDNGF